jgi:hypothetical protein
MMVSSSTSPGLERLADHIGSSHHVDVLFAGSFLRPLDRLLHP